ncbi:IS66 family transposase [Vibrio rumoiensis]|uniref:IS66 family transposase n=1 Tax=Vibrio rumoiensis TaxID=76258 RepID=UPI000D78BFD8|nr:IS66 family transposase [Vibrio rumoiensis]
MTRKKAPKYQDAPPKVSDLNEAKVLIDELWEQLRHYEDKLTTSSKNSSKSPSSDSPKDRHERKKNESSGGRNSRGAKKGHTGHQRKLSPLKDTDIIIDCFPDSCPCCEQSDIDVHDGPYYRHQVFDIPKPTVDITEYRLFSGQCRHCKAVKAQKPDDASQGIIGPNLLSYIGVLAGQYHLSVRKIQSLLKEQLGTTFSVGAISEAQTKVASMLTPLHQAIKQALKKAPLIHADETSHHRNDEQSLRWCWLVASDDLVYEQILYSRSTSSAKKVIDEDYAGIVVSDQCPSYNWIAADRHQLCWAHVKRNLQQMADYSGGGHTAYIGRHLCLLTNAIFHTRHRYEQDELNYALYLRRMRRLQKSFDHWLSKGTDVMVKRYRGRCKLLLKHRESLWVFLKKVSIPLTNNEAERCIRGFVIQRKISFGTTSDAGDKFRSRIHTLIETCKKRGLSAMSVLSEIITAVVAKRPYPNIFDL